jgi:hypothetical protein
VGGGSGSLEYRTQAEAEHAARAELLASGGGELVVKGKDGKVRDQTMVGKGEVHKGADAHKGGEAHKSADTHKGADAHKSSELPKAKG